MALAGAVRTETLRVQLGGPLEFPQGPDGRRFATTWMVALQLAAGEVLGIDSRQIGGLLVPRSVPAGVVHDVLLFDQIAGGAGHCRSLLDRWEELVDAAYGRLDCPNERCTDGCHRCLIAFETQRYEDLLRRTALRAFLESRWALAKEKPRKDGIAVGARFRKGAEIREALARGEAATVTVLAPAVAPDALNEEGWLPALLRHAEGRGRARLIIERLPDPNADADRFIAARLRIAMAGGKLELFAAKRGITSTRWCITLSDPAHAFYIEGAQGEALGPGWLREAAVYEAVTDSDRRTVLERIDLIVGACRRAAPEDLEPEPPTEKTIVHNVRAGETGANATFDRWFRRADGGSVFAEPIAELTIADPYLATEWQLKLLAELMALVTRAGCATIRVLTYAPREEVTGFGQNRSVTAEEQRLAVSSLTGEPRWKPMDPPSRNLDRMHKRVIQGVRKDGTRFEVLLERGLDFIVDRGRGTRLTRESYVVVRDPA